MTPGLSAFIRRVWYERHPLSYLLLPPAALTAAAVAARRLWFKRFKPKAAPLPVIVAGGLTVGGAGKTPLVAALAERLKHEGRKPGIVSRGYGARRRDYPYSVQPGDDAEEVGDEPLLLRCRTGCPVVIAPNRRRAVEYLAKHTDADVALSDDGLQHYRLHRDVEIAVVDRFGNGRLLPAGPLREPRSRLAETDIVVVNRGGPHRDAGRKPDPDAVEELLETGRAGEAGRAGRFSMTLRPLGFENLATGETLPCSAFAGCSVHACAGIGDPRRFFDVLASLGVCATPHAYPDHHRYRARDLVFEDAAPVVMTEKDAVKCRRLVRSKTCPEAWPEMWSLKVEAMLEEEFWKCLGRLLVRRAAGHNQ